MIYKILSTKKEVNVISYIREYLKQYPDVEILIGTDSQNRKKNTVFATCVVLYRPKKGGHVLYQKTEVPRLKDIYVRLMDEVWRSIEISELIKNELGKIVKWIDIDINNDKRYKSNTVLSAAVGLVESYSYNVRYKHHPKDLPVVNYICDQLVK